MRNLKLNFEEFKKNEISKAKLITVFGGGEEDPGDKPKTGTTTSNTGVGMSKTGQEPLPIPKPLP